MSIFAVFKFLFWKSLIACKPIFVYFPLVGISLLSSVNPLYSIFSQGCMFVLLDLGFLVFLGMLFCSYVVVGSCGVALAIIE